MEQTILDWVGESTYETVEEFLDEFRKMPRSEDFMDTLLPHDSDWQSIKLLDECGFTDKIEFKDDGTVTFYKDVCEEQIGVTIHIDDLERICNTVRAFMMTR